MCPDRRSVEAQEAMLNIKKIWSQVKLSSSKEKQVGSWKQALGGATEEEDGDKEEEEKRKWREHKQRVRQDYRREMNWIRGRDQEREERWWRERREMERWQRKKRAELRRALREQEVEPAPQAQRQDRNQLEAGFLSTLRSTWFWPGRTRVAPAEARQLNWFNSLEGEECRRRYRHRHRHQHRHLQSQLRVFSFHPITDDVIEVFIV